MYIKKNVDSIEIFEYDKEKLLIIPWFKAKFRFNPEISNKIKILIPDDFDDNDIKTLINIINYTHNIYNEINDLNINNFIKVNLFLGLNEYYLPDKYQIEILNTIEPEDKYYSLYLNTLPEIKKIITAESDGNFDFQEFSKKYIEYKEFDNKLKKFILYKNKSHDFKYINSIDNIKYTSYYNNDIEDDKHISDTSIWQIKHKFNDRCFFKLNQFIKNMKSFKEICFQLANIDGIYICGDVILLTFTADLYADSIIILITKSFHENFNKVFKLIYEKYKYNLYIEFQPEYCIINSCENNDYNYKHFIIPRFHTLKSWFSYSIDSYCIALYKNNNNKFDLIYSKRFEYSFSNSINLVQPHLNDKIHFEQYYTAIKLAIYPCVPACLHLYNNYFSKVLNDIDNNIEYNFSCLLKSIYLNDDFKDQIIYTSNKHYINFDIDINNFYQQLIINYLDAKYFFDITYQYPKKNINFF